MKTKGFGFSKSLSLSLSLSPSLSLSHSAVLYIRRMKLAFHDWPSRLGHGGGICSTLSSGKGLAREKEEASV
jgi:hypothetical protein